MNIKRMLKDKYMIAAIVAVIVVAVMFVIFLMPEKEPEVPVDVEQPPEHVHTLSDWIVGSESTCAKKGYQFKECTDCKEVVESQVLEKSDHIPEEEWTVATEPTCTKNGLKLKSCQICGEQVASEIISATKHVNGEWVTEATPSCLETGKRHSICSVCDYVTVEITPVLEHSYGDYVTNKEPTCLEAGEKSSICLLCRVEETTVELPALGHDYKDNTCNLCKKTVSSKGLLFKLNEDQKSYTFTGFGTCTDLNVVIDLYNDLPVTAIQYYARYQTINAQSLVIGDSVETIAANSFSRLESLKSVTFKGSVKSIGDSAFYGCTSLEIVDISDIGGWCETEFGNVTSTPMFYSGAFTVKGVSYTELALPKGTTKIGNYAFYGCSSIKTAYIPSTVAEIGKYAFFGCEGLERIEIPKAATEIGEYAFGGCTALETVIFNSGLKKIDKYAFSNCIELKEVVLPDSLSTIGENVFDSCSSLTKVVLSKKLKEIPIGAFNKCKTLENVNIPVGVTKINANAFYNCSSLTSVDMPATVIDIGVNAFSGCSGLKYVRVPDGISKINTGVFLNCTSLEYIILPKSVKSIDVYAFSGCDSLKKVYYYGTESEYELISISNWNTPIDSATVYYYSKTKPSDDGNYWYDSPSEWAN